MRPSIAITLILCGTLMAAMPIIAHHIGMEIADVGALCYLGLAAIMIVSAIVGSVVNARISQSHGFDPLPLTT